MVMNHDTYPNLLQFFADLGVPLEPTDMSFCVSDAQHRTWTFGWHPLAWLTMLPTPRFWHWVRSTYETRSELRFKKVWDCHVHVFANGPSSPTRKCKPLNPRFQVLAMDRFHGEALAALDHPSEGAGEPIGAWLSRRGYHESIVGGWLVPFCAAVWSSPTAAAGAMDARALFGFL
jgi:predicted NAD/FAD-binding protein